MPVPWPMVATLVFEELQEARTTEPLTFALKFTTPELKDAVKLLEPWEVQPEQAIVNPPPPPLVLTVNVA